MSKKVIKAVIVGASGYTGAELARILAGHGAVRIVAATADRKAGTAFGEAFPHLAGAAVPDLVSLDRVDWTGVDAAFCCLPHGASQEIIAALPERVRVIDLSADFRLADGDLYAQWYGAKHKAMKLQKEAVYGLSELARAEIAGARLVACPGCYPTSAQLPLIPLVKAGLIDADDIIIDAKSGVSGAGRALKETSLYAEAAEGISAYGIAGHRHIPEIEQGLGRARGRPVAISFTPHLTPMNRGILSTIYVKMAKGKEASDLRDALVECYRGEPFVRITAMGVIPSTRHVRGSNYCLIGVFADRPAGRAVIVSVIDNLVKGASGQAVQNMNIMFGLPETMGLEQQPLFP
ncbi:MAG: N-acetyl-gamma-glutamyl-phosphate reductase [Rhodospirillales bacterium RIFCSPLOWO2_12_FULL_58_28]|nr:MAG: N-acetyl-gamma-glutamyl-phosphate reductase [Rhodospirillales bacterium RIFCSPLOWO2_02_FULL_58_16]OHC79952.1 MAG: N-acetyl-gamma-glutamyl-phosphate reductase [Rhodospirillales bacterium RIFCSPLOWO2_12_FULL_58_28]